MVSLGANLGQNHAVFGRKQEKLERQLALEAQDGQFFQVGRQLVD